MRKVANMEDWAEEYRKKHSRLLHFVNDPILTMEEAEEFSHRLKNQSPPKAEEQSQVKSSSPKPRN